MNKRKSLLIAGRRRSQSVGGILPSKICETIPKSLPPAERLQMLLKSVFHHTITTFSREISEKDIDIPKFKTDAFECWDEIESTLAEKRLCQLAVSTDNVEMKENGEIDINTVNCQEAIKRYDEERQKWDTIITNERQALHDAINKGSTQQNLEDGSNIAALKNGRQALQNAINTKTEVAEIDKILAFDYTEIRNESVAMFDDLQNKVATLTQTGNMLRGCLNASKEFMQKTNDEAERFFSEPMDDSPKTLIKMIAKKSVKDLD